MGELLETIMGRGHDESTEFDLITAELKDMGMDEEDIEDLKQLSELMYEFLKQIPSLVTKLQLVEEYDLLDNVQLYLLGLPNKLGPLGYVALQYVLEELNDSDGEIVDIKVESLQPSGTTSSAAQNTEAPSFRRKRSCPLSRLCGSGVPYKMIHGSDSYLLKQNCGQSSDHLSKIIRFKLFYL